MILLRQWRDGSMVLLGQWRDGSMMLMGQWRGGSMAILGRFGGGLMVLLGRLGHGARLPSMEYRTPSTRPQHRRLHLPRGSSRLHRSLSGGCSSHQKRPAARPALSSTLRYRCNACPRGLSGGRCLQPKRHAARAALTSTERCSHGGSERGRRSSGRGTRSCRPRSRRPSHRTSES
ncbi:unnamed protein product [Ectocarpus fasciculatus]